MAGVRHEPFVVFGFGTTHEALSAEELLKAHGLRVVPIPTPRELGALCGIAMRLPLEEEDEGRALLEGRGLGPERTARIEDVVAGG